MEMKHDLPARRLDTLSYREGFIIGVFQSSALLAGISRSGVTMVGGLLRGLNHEDAARFSFLAATPAIFAAGHQHILDGDRQSAQSTQRRAGRAAAIDLLGARQRRISISAKESPDVAVIPRDLI